MIECHLREDNIVAQNFDAKTKQQLLSKLRKLKMKDVTVLEEDHPVLEEESTEKTDGQNLEEILEFTDGEEDFLGIGLISQSLALVDDFEVSFHTTFLFTCFVDCRVLFKY